MYRFRTDSIYFSQVFLLNGWLNSQLRNARIKKANCIYMRHIVNISSQHF